MKRDNLRKDWGSQNEIRRKCRPPTDGKMYGRGEKAAFYSRDIAAKMILSNIGSITHLPFSLIIPYF